MGEKHIHFPLDECYRLHVDLSTEKGCLAAFSVALEFQGSEEWHTVGTIEKRASEKTGNMEEALDRACGRLTKAREQHRAKRGRN